MKGWLMRLFKRKKSSGPEDFGSAPITSIVGKDMTICGNISFQGKLRLDGKIEGDVQGENLILGETGHITGDVEVQVFVCHGTVTGDIKVQKLFAIEGCKIHGTIHTADLSVESGASVCGDVKTSANDLRLVPGFVSKPEERLIKELRS